MSNRQCPREVQAGKCTGCETVVYERAVESATAIYGETEAKVVAESIQTMVKAVMEVNFPVRIVGKEGLTCADRRKTAVAYASELILKYDWKL